jgi:hypothetical protein
MPLCAMTLIFFAHHILSTLAANGVKWSCEKSKLPSAYCTLLKVVFSSRVTLWSSGKLCYLSLKIK